MSAVAALKAARAAGIEFGLDGDDLTLQASAPPSTAMIDLLSRHKLEIVALLRDAGDGPTAKERRAMPGERIGLIDGEAGIPGQWIAGHARLLTMKRPLAVPDRDWQGMVDVAGRLLRCRGRELASLGWTAVDIFGVHRLAPMARLDHAGLVRFLRRFEVLEINAANAVIGNARGVRHTYWCRRDQRDAGWTLLWDLDGWGGDE